MQFKPSKITNRKETQETESTLLVKAEFLSGTTKNNS